MTPVGRAVAAIAARWHVTEGQVYTAIIGALLALAAAIGGLPPAMAKHTVVPAETPGTTTTLTSAP
jgi:hypothetical protein